MDITKLEQLAELRLQEREIALKIDALIPEVKQEIEDAQLENGTELKVSSGVFTVSYRRTWTYPSYVEKAKEEYNVLKKKSEQTGDATYKEAPSVIFKSEGIEE